MIIVNNTHTHALVKTLSLYEDYSIGCRATQISNEKTSKTK